MKILISFRSGTCQRVHKIYINDKNGGNILVQIHYENERTRPFDRHKDVNDNESWLVLYGLTALLKRILFCDVNNNSTFER